MSARSSARSALAARSIVTLTPAGLRTKRFWALTTMVLPLLGTAAAAGMLATGHWDQTDIALFCAMYAVHMLGVSVGLHRLATHRSFRTSPWLTDALMVAGAMAAQGPLLFWVATHRAHHSFSDQEGDPHSPNLHGAGWKARLRGLWYAHMPWMLSGHSHKWSVFARDVLDDRHLVFHHNMYPVWVLLGLALPTALGGVIGHGWSGAFGGLVFGGLARIAAANQAAWCVGSICHAYGSRPFPNGDHSANNMLVALLTFGEGLQNNHHAFPHSFRHATRWWEPDPSGWLIAALGKAGLAWGLREPSTAAIEQRRTGG